MKKIYGIEEIEGKVTKRCNSCGALLRFPKTKKILVITCPICKNSFEYKSSDTKQYNILATPINLFYRLVNLIAKIMSFSASMDSVEKEKEEEKQKLRDQFVSSDNYVYLKNFVKKYIAYNTAPPVTEIEKLRLLLNKNGFYLDYEELEELIKRERNRQEYNEFERKLLQNKKSDNFWGYIKSFVELYGDDLGYKLEWLKYFLREHRIAFEETELIKELASIKEELELNNFKENLIADNAQFISMHDIDLMNGFEFEHFLKNLFEKMGYSVNSTKLSGDQGGDLIISKLGEKIVVQAKRNSSKVSNKAIQEVVAAIKYYNANKGVVITNNEFTKSAIELAETNNVDLIDRNKLQQLIEKYL